MKLRLLKAVCTSFVMIVMLLMTCMPSEMQNAYAYGQDPLIVSGGIYFVRNVHSGQYLDVEGGLAVNYTTILQHPKHGASNQRWKFIYMNDGTYKILSMVGSGNMAMDIYSNSNTNGADVQIIQDNGTTAQRFAIERLANGAVIIRTKTSGYAKAVVVENASLSPCANVFQWQYNASHNDEWILEPVASGVEQCAHGYNVWSNGTTGHFVLDNGVGPNVRYYYIDPSALGYYTSITDAAIDWVNTSTTPGVTTKINWASTANINNSICDIYYRNMGDDGYGATWFFDQNGFKFPDAPYRTYRWCEIELNTLWYPPSNCTWFNRLNPFRKQSVISHELGHVMGLTHVLIADRIMCPNPWDCTVNRAQVADLITINHIYP